MRVLWAALSLSILGLSSCSNSGGHQSIPSTMRIGSPNMGGPSEAERAAQIAAEPRGDFYYGRRYHVKKTRFWGYLRRPGQPATTGKLVIFNEKKKRAPDRLPEGGSGRTFGYDNNYDYKISGYYSGRTLYEPNSNMFLPEFVLTGYQQLDTDPGWLFSPQDYYSPLGVTLKPGGWRR